MSGNNKGAAAAEWRAGWKLTLVSAVALAVSVSHLYSFGVFIPELERAFNWNRTQITVGLTIVSVMTVSLAPFMGALIDRFGSRRIGLPGTALYCLAIAGLSLAGPGLLSWWAGWVLVAFGSLCVKPTVWTTAIATRFDHGRGLAMAVALCGTGLGSTFHPVIASYLVENLGWRHAYLALAAIDAVVALPLLFLFFYDSADEARRSRESAGPVDRNTLPGLGLRQALRSPQFAKLAIVSLAFTVGMTAVIVPFVPMMMEGGLRSSHAAATAGLIGIASVCGRLITGILLDRYDSPNIGLFFALAPPLVGCLLLTMPLDQLVATLMAILFGFGLGAEVDCISYLASRFFGMRHLGVLLGSLMGLMSLGSGLGPLLSSYLYDVFSDYQAMPLAVSPLLILCGLLVITLGRPPPKAGEVAKS